MVGLSIPFFQASLTKSALSLLSIFLSSFFPHGCRPKWVRNHKIDYLSQFHILGLQLEKPSSEEKWVKLRIEWSNEEKLNSRHGSQDQFDGSSCGSWIQIPKWQLKLWCKLLGSTSVCTQYPLGEFRLSWPKKSLNLCLPPKDVKIRFNYDGCYREWFQYNLPIVGKNYQVFMKGRERSDSRL